MKIQDKEELQYKQNNKGNDKDGTIAAKLREKLSGIMKNYNLLEMEDDNNKYGKPEKYDKYIKDKHENHKNKVGIFNDKRLNQLWNKAEYAGFTAEELEELRKEFSNYQDKVDNYYNALDEKIQNRYHSKTFFEFFPELWSKFRQCRTNKMLMDFHIICRCGQSRRIGYIQRSYTR